MSTVPLSLTDEKQHAWKFIQGVCDYLGANTDTQLANVLKIEKSLISKMRSGSTKINGTHLIRIYDVTGLSIEQLRAMLYQREVLPPVKPDISAFRFTQDLRRTKSGRYERKKAI